MIGNQIIYLDRVDSTSNYVATLISEGKARHGMVILAEIQTNGRGQRGATWQSEDAKNLLLSIYLEHKDLEISKQESLTHFISLGLSNTLLHFGISNHIKWPNDILVGSKKIAGILIENQLRSSKINTSIIGVGINILQTTFDFKGSTSVSLESKTPITKENFLSELIKQLNHLYPLVQYKIMDKLKNEYLSKLWLLGVESPFESNGENFIGKILGTDNFGRLLVEVKKEIKTFDLKEIKFTLRNEP